MATPGSSGCWRWRSSCVLRDAGDPLRERMRSAPAYGHVAEALESCTCTGHASDQSVEHPQPAATPDHLRVQCDCEDPSGSCSAAHSHSSRQISSMSERLARPRLTPRMNSNAGKSSRCQLTGNSQGQLAVFAIDLAPYGLRAGSHHNWHHAWVPDRLRDRLLSCRCGNARSNVRTTNRRSGRATALHAHISSRDTSFLVGWT
jgi:hypothetical protein